MTASLRPRPRHPYVRLMETIGGLNLLRQVDEGERQTILESAAIGQVLAQYGCYLVAIAMVWLGGREVTAWSLLLFLVPALSQTLAGMSGWVKRRQLGMARLSTRSQMVAGIPVFVMSMLWLAGFVTRATEGSIQSRLLIFALSLAITVGATFVFVRAGRQEQERADRALAEEDDDEF